MRSTVRVAMMACALLGATASLAQPPLPPPFPRLNATKLLETDRIVVWNIVWPKGQPTAMHRHPYDQVGTYYARGGRVITNTDGTKRETMTEVGSLSTTRKGTTHIEEGNTDPPLKAVFIELKQDSPRMFTLKNTNSPPMFPRDAAKPLLDDDRVIAWDYTVGGRRSFVAGHDTVIVYLGGGTIVTWPGRSGPGSMTGGGATPLAMELGLMTRIVEPGSMRYLPGGTIETEQVVNGSPRMIAFELK